MLTHVAGNPVGSSFLASLRASVLRVAVAAGGGPIEREALRTSRKSKMVLEPYREKEAEDQ